MSTIACCFIAHLVLADNIKLLAKNFLFEIAISTQCSGSNLNLRRCESDQARQLPRCRLYAEHRSNSIWLDNDRMHGSSHAQVSDPCRSDLGYGFGRVQSARRIRMRNNRKKTQVHRRSTIFIEFESSQTSGFAFPDCILQLLHIASHAFHRVRQVSYT